MPHFLHACKGAVIEVSRVIVAFSAAPLQSHTVIIAAPKHDFVVKRYGLIFQFTQTLIVLPQEGFKTFGIKRECQVQIVVNRSCQQFTYRILIAFIDMLGFLHYRLRLLAQ